jgi:branched-chain amino acid transport system ATP-binding protein
MPALLEVDDLSKDFGGLRAVVSMTFDVRESEVVGLLGPNGSGKTTVLNLISGALRPSAGRIRVDGREITALPPYRIAWHGVARTFQIVRVLPSMTVESNVIAGMPFSRSPAFGRAAHEQARAIIARVGLKDRQDRYPAELTYIDQKRVELARALAANPRILLLDEWLAGLNPAELNVGIGLIRSLQDEGRTIVMVEHVMDAIRSLCSSCIVMNAGEKIAEGKTRAVLANPKVIQAYLGDEHA